MLKNGTAALALVLASPGVAQTTAPPAPPAPAANAAPPPGFIEAARSYGQCVGARAQGVDAKVAPEAAAKTVLAACARHKGEMERTFEGWLQSNKQMTEPQKAAARAQLRAGLANAEGEVAGKIRQARAAAARPKK